MNRKHDLVFWLFLTPVLIAFIMVIIIPFGIGIFYSFTNWSATARAGQGISMLGFTNFANSLKDPSFAWSFIMTTVFTIINIALVNAAALALALAVTSKLKLRNIYRTSFFVPNLIGGIILGFIWQFIFNRGIPAIGGFIPLFANWANPENLMLGRVSTALFALSIVNTWQYAGYIMMIYIAAIEGVPQELYEAATIDGANFHQRFRAIVVPMIAQAFTITIFLTLVNSFKQFDVNVSLTSGGPSTIFAGKAVRGTELLAMNIFSTAFVGLKLAEAQARALIFFLVLVVFTTIQVKVNKRKEIEL
ncbi:MAG: ABC transporter permease [Spirochaeta sp. LUC14_002_19_P3]|nr:MAG: ABC transporter permease [Spirochaeta sp. LUC14_002_19_P3]